MQHLTEKVTAIIVEQLGCDESEVQPDAHFEHDLGADSLDRLELTHAIEDEFCLDIRQQDADKLLTVGDLTTYLTRRLSAPAAKTA